MSGPITIRNLTAQPLTVKLVERYEAPNPKDFQPNGGFSVSKITSNFTLLMKNDTKPTNAQIHESAQSFARQDVDVLMEPFTTHKTDIKLTERTPTEILRLTFQGDGGGRWRIDMPAPCSASRTLTPLVPDPKHGYTAIYLAEKQFLAIFESTDMNCWMMHLKDETPLTGLSIPGTHNSPTHHKALPSVRCQAVSPREQLENGIRFFDIRVQPANPGDPKDDTLILVHSVFPVSLTGTKKFRGLLDDVYAFLQANPSETLIMSIKREGTGDATDQQLSNILKDHYTNPQQWWTKPWIPSLGEARGKVVLLRRFANAPRLGAEWEGKGWGLKAENWADNTPNNTCGDVCVQDFYEVLETENIEKKISYCCDHFERAGAAICPIPGVTTDSTNPVLPGPLFINFLSASNFWKVGCWPHKIAAKINPATTAWLCEKHGVGDKGIEGPGQAFQGDGGVGIVVCDWVGHKGDWDLVRCIVGMNARLLLRQKGVGWK